MGSIIKKLMHLLFSIYILKTINHMNKFQTVKGNEAKTRTVKVNQQFSDFGR